MLLGYYSHLLQKRWEFLYPRRHEKARRRRPPSATAERKTKRGLAICPSVFPQPLQKTVHPPEGLTPKAKEKWLEEEAALFERQCRNEPLPVDKSITLAAYTAYWLAHIAPGKLAKSTLARDKQDIDRFLPTLGSYKLTDLLLSDSRISNTMWFTVRYAVVSVAGTLLISMVLALAMNNVSRRVSGMFRTLYYLPAILSGLAIGLIWNQLFSNGLPQIGSLLNIPWLSKNILGDVNLAFWGVAFTGFWGGVATPTLLLLASLQNIPKDILESAAIRWGKCLPGILAHQAPLYAIYHQPHHYFDAERRPYNV